MRSSGVFPQENATLFDPKTPQELENRRNAVPPPSGRRLAMQHATLGPHRFHHPLGTPAQSNPLQKCENGNSVRFPFHIHPA
jgi:hypothetical protein